MSNEQNGDINAHPGQPQPAAVPVGWMTHHDEPMLFPTRQEAAQYCEDDEDPIALLPAASCQYAAGQADGVAAMAKMLREILDGRPCLLGSDPPELFEVAQRLTQQAAPAVICGNGSLIAQARDWQAIALREAAELSGTPEGAARLVESRRYGVLADALSAKISATDVDALGNYIREIDGSNAMGAGELAEKIMAWIAFQSSVGKWDIR